MGEVPAGVSQLDAQAQLDPVSHGGLGGFKLRRQGGPVIGPPKVRAGPDDGLHMVGEAKLVQPRLDGGLRQGGHGIPAVWRNPGVDMVIRQIHGLVHLFFLPLPKKPLRSS